MTCDRGFALKLAAARETFAHKTRLTPGDVHETLSPSEPFDVPGAVEACKVLAMMGFKPRPNNGVWVRRA